MQMFHKVV